MDYLIEKESGFSDFFYCEKCKSPLFVPHIHSHIEFVFVTEGTLNIKVANKEYILNKNFAAVIMPYELHDYQGNDESEVFVIACPAEYFQEYKQTLSNKLFEPPVAPFGKVHRTIIEDIEKNNFEDDLKKKALIYCTLSTFLKECTFREKEVFEYDVYRKAVVYISENYTDDITLEKTAFYVGVTAAHLSRVLNSDGKPGFSEILNSLRVYRAKHILERENMPVSEAALAAGFGSIRNFNRIFKKYFKCSPGNIKKTSSR